MADTKQGRSQLYAYAESVDKVIFSFSNLPNDTFGFFSLLLFNGSDKKAWQQSLKPLWNTPQLFEIKFILI